MCAALGRQFGKIIVGLEGAADVADVRYAGTARYAMEIVAETALTAE